jgi:hypothetical protein
MSIQREVNQCAELGKAFARQAAVVARETAKVISDQAEERLRDAQPVVRETFQNAATAFQKRARNLRHSAGIVAVRTLVAASRKMQSCTARHLTVPLSLLKSAGQALKSAATCFALRPLLLSVVIGLIVTGYSSWQARDQSPVSSITSSLYEKNTQFVNGRGLIEPQPLQLEEAAIVKQDPLLAAAQAEFEQAAGEYEYALQQWNAEVATCQSAPAAQYSSRQMGMFAATGVRAPAQAARQPNEYLYQVACQAEQRFLHAKSNLEACMR